MRALAVVPETSIVEEVMNAFGKIAMTDVLEELTAESLSRDHVEQRLADWEARIRSLYAQIAFWLKDDRTIVVGVVEKAVRLDEEPMRDTGVGVRTLPSLAIYINGESRARLEPRGLWIIGANGRLDLVAGLERQIIVDAAENFAQPRWTIMPASDRTIRAGFTPDRLRAVLGLQ